MTNRAGAPVTLPALEKAWKNIRTAAGLTNARLHDLRHTVGTHADQAGLNAFAVRDVLGHKTLAMTGRYVSADHSRLQAAAEQATARIAAAMRPETAEGDEAGTTQR
ncbi:MAG: tyrosine-type recombinase/integrase [Pirellulales bacterium]